MLSLLFQKLFSRKWELLILGAIVIICAVGSKILTIDYWESTGYNMASYPPWLPFVMMIWGGAAIGILIVRRYRSPAFWIMSISGVVFGIIMFWAMYVR